MEKILLFYKNKDRKKEKVTKAEEKNQRKNFLSPDFFQLKNRPTLKAVFY